MGEARDRLPRHSMARSAGRRVGTGRSRRLWAAAWIALLMAGGSPVPAQQRSGSFDDPALYLMNEAQIRRYQAMRDAAARRAYLEAFWASLDPDPKTPGNPVRETFERRLAEVNHRFGNRRSDGWRTDPGRVWLLLGPPDERHYEPGGTRSAPREIWRYHHVPGVPVSPVEIVFLELRPGRFVLEDRPAEARPWIPPDALTRLRRREERRRELGAMLPVGDAAMLQQMMEAIEAADEASILSDPGRTSRPPARAPARPVRAGRREAPSSSGIEGLREDVYFFQAADGHVLAVLAAAVEPERLFGSPSEAVEAGAWFSPDDSGEGEDALFVPLDPAPVRKSSGRRILGGRAYLDPGRRYRVRLAVADPKGSQVRIRNLDLDVPVLKGGGLWTSSVVPAESFGAAETPSEDPFVVGSERVIPRPGGTFHLGETLGLYLQVYGARPDPTSIGPRLDLRFRFYRREKKRWRKFRKPLEVLGARGDSLGVALPVGDWPPGDYRVRVRVQDVLTGRVARAEGRFTLVEAP